MRRMLFTTVAVLFTAVLLAACGGGGDDAPAAGGSMMPMDETGGHPEETGGHMEGDAHGGGDHGDASDVAEGAREIAVTASSFAFDPEEIEVEAGEDVAVALTSTDILHDFTIDELDAHVAAGAGETATGGFRAEEEGRYTFYCSVAGHREAGMQGVLVAEG